MKKNNRFFAILAAVALTAMVGCAGTTTQESAGQYVDDTAITTKIKAAIFKDPSLKSSEINVETFKGRVQLSGFVASPGDVSQAVAIAQGVNGVSSVENDMRVK
jgi:osmotically-inducible protein OsmY